EDVGKRGDVWIIDGRGYANDDSTEHLDSDLVIHREGGDPAIIYESGHYEWLEQGQHHREDGPALTRPDGHKEWWVEGMLHREDGPAKIKENGVEEYWLFNEEVDESTMLKANLMEREREGEAKEDNKEEAESEAEDVRVKVRVKSFKINSNDSEKIHSLFFVSVEEFINACYKDSDGRYRIKLGEWVDAVVHCESGPAVEYSDDRVSYVIDGKSIGKAEFEDRLAKEHKSSQIIIKPDGADPVYVNNHDELWESFLAEDVDGRIRWRDSGEVLSNKFAPAIEYKDGTTTYIVNGHATDHLHAQMNIGATYNIEYTQKWDVGDWFDFPTTRAAAWLEHEGTPVWRMEVHFEGTDFVYEMKLPLTAINPGALAVHPIITDTELSLAEAFCTGQFINHFAIDLLRYGPDVAKTNIVYEKFRDRFEEHLQEPLDDEKNRLDNLSPVPESVESEEEISFGVPLACLAIAGLAGIAASKKKTTHKKGLKGKSSKKEVVEELRAVAR
ncbi:MAG: hypothetical protein ACXABY_25615, partial [Candidatus Thorarchaeota archaeon]